MAEFLKENEYEVFCAEDGEKALVNVWNVGCTPCVNEIPDLDKINSEYKDKGAAVYGLYGDLGMGISDDEMAQIKDIMSNANASYTQLRMDGTLSPTRSKGMAMTNTTRMTYFK